MASQEFAAPRGPAHTDLEVTVDTIRIAHPVPEETRECGTCSRCGTRAKTLTAPRPNVGHGYRGPMYCLPCNPRFRTLDAQWSGLERMGG